MKFAIVNNISSLDNKNEPGKQNYKQCRVVFKSGFLCAVKSGLGCANKSGLWLKNRAMKQDDGFGFWTGRMFEIIEVAVWPEALDHF